MRKSTLCIGIASLLLFASCKKSLNEPVGDEGQDAVADQMFKSGVTQKYVPNELLVKFKQGSPTSRRSDALLRISATVEEQVVTAAMRNTGDNEGFYVVKTSMDPLEAMKVMKGSSDVAYAEPNWIYTYGATSNDPSYTGGSLWGMYGDATIPANQYGSQAAEAWAANKTDASSVYIGIIDEGYMYTHEDLAANAGKNPGEIAGNGIDDDNNGYVDDVYGWDFDGNNNTVFDGTGDDHGTHVAGTIGGTGGNGIGVAGVVWKVKLLSGKFLGSRGGTTANAIKAVDYFTNLKAKGINIVATNNSWGGGGFSQALQDAIKRAEVADILFIAAAGNDGANIETSTSYPSGYPNSNIIAVASITNTGALSSFSNYAATKVDIGAPGSGIYSTLPGGKGRTVTSSYGSYSGTSMATPHVAGAAALYAAYHPGSSAATIKNAILGSAVPTASLTGKCSTGGRLNVSGF
jgi:subtilisin family serine protease